MIPVIVAFIYTRCVNIGDIPYYLDKEELDAAMSAMSIALGNGNLLASPSALVYVAAAIFGLRGGLFSIRIFRLLAVAGGLFGMIFSYLTVWEMTGKKRYGFLEAITVVSLPVFYLSQRSCVPAFRLLDIVPAAFFFLIKSVRSPKHSYRIAAAFFWILALIIWIFDNRVMGPGFIPSNIMNIKALLWDDGHPFNVISGFGTVYVFSLPVAVVGMIVSFRKAFISIKEKKVDAYVILWVYILIMFIAGMMAENADTRTFNGLFFAVSLLICEGLIIFCENLKGVMIIEVLVYLAAFILFSSFYHENINSEINNSRDHEEGTVIDPGLGETIQSAAIVFPDRDIAVVGDDFSGRDLIIELYGNTDSYSSDRISVDIEEITDLSGSTVYIIDQFKHQDMINYLLSYGWKTAVTKEYTICYTM